MADNKLIGRIEAVLFASGDPVEVAKLSQILKADKGEIANAIDVLKKRYAKTSSGIALLELDQSIQLASKEEYGEYIKEALMVKKNAPLSSAAMEVLAIIAYNQPEPVTKSFVEQIRGVDSSQTVNALVEKGLVEEAGRHNLPGRPIVYRTTDVFLRSFGISNISELPPLPTEEKQLELELPQENEPTQDGVENEPTQDGVENKPTQDVVENEPTQDGVEDEPTQDGVEDKPTQDES